MRFDWQPEYDALAQRFLQRHFGGPHLAESFPCMRAEYRWGAHRPLVADARIPAKNNTEYHGLEQHASQYHLTAQYEFAYHHWLMAGFWRVVDAKSNNFHDAGHENAVSYCVRQALYNKSLYEWQRSPVRNPPPQPEQFDLTRKDIDGKDRKAEDQIEAYLRKKASSETKP